MSPALRSALIQTPGWLYLFVFYDWRVALALFLVFWGNNVDLAHRIPRTERPK